MNRDEFLVEFGDAAERAAMDVPEISLRMGGWEREDAKQQAYVRLLELANSKHARDRINRMSSPGGFVRQSVRRAINRGMRGVRHVLVPINQVKQELIEARGVSWVEEFVATVLLFAPPDIEKYLRTVLVDQDTLQETASLRWRAVGRIRKKAIQWLMTQYEVRR